MRSILTSLIILHICYGCEVESNHQIDSSNFEFIELGKGIYSCIHTLGGKAICNVGVVDNGKETIIFDSFLSPEVAEELLEGLGKMNLSPVRYVVNSHSHNDHIRGNQVFGPDINIISTSITRDLIEKWEPLDIADEKDYAPVRLAYYDSLFQSFEGSKSSKEYQDIMMWRPYYEILSKSHLEIKTRLPDTYVDSIQILDGPTRSVRLLSMGKGHTASDLVLYLPDDKVLFSGDLIFNKCHPFVAHGSIPEWKNWLNFFSTLDIDTIMPGHGSIGSKGLIDEMKRYLSSLEIRALDLRKSGYNPDSIDEIDIPDEYRDWWLDRFYPTNLKFATEILE